jgi:hypothetical protein
MIHPKIVHPCFIDSKSLFRERLYHGSGKSAETR